MAKIVLPFKFQKLFGKMLLLIMYYIRLVFLLIAGTAMFFLLVGLFKPWIMLWWEDIQNRKKVIKVYGAIAVVTYATYLILHLVK